MNGVQPWMKLKVNADTFFLPDQDGSVYFRNNAGSFRMNGTAIQSWLEKLLPVFNGTESLWSVTDGLPAPYRERIYEIARILYENGFVRDVSQDEPHQLSDEVLQYYAPQIEFVDSLLGSGAYHFQLYRNAKVLVISSSEALPSLVDALLESGLKTVNLIAADGVFNASDVSIDESRLKEIILFHQNQDRETDVNDLTDEVRHRGKGILPTDAHRENYEGASEATITDDGPKLTALRDIVRHMDAVIYFSEQGDVDTLHQVESICREQQKGFIPAIYLNGLGMAGPLVWPNGSNGQIGPNGSPNGPDGNGPTASTWDTAYRRIHHPVFESDLGVSKWTGTAAALLANLVVFELFKSITGVSDEEAYQRFYTLNPETLEGTWHGFIPAPSMQALDHTSLITDLREQLMTEAVGVDSGDLLAYFAQITDSTSGIFHTWEEGALSQLPLSQCSVQTVDPLSEGPASLQSEMVCTGLRHEDARREAGLVGIEAYVERIVRAGPSIKKEPAIGVGAGATLAEAVGRGLLRTLATRLQQKLADETPTIQAVELGTVNLGSVNDEKVQFYLQALRDAGVEPVVGQSEDVFGFPVAWVGPWGPSEGFVGSVGMNFTMALQQALEQALCFVSNPTSDSARCLTIGTVLPTVVKVVASEGPSSNRSRADIGPWTGYDGKQVLKALGALAANGHNVSVVDLCVEPFLTDVLAGVVGVAIREGGSA